MDAALDNMENADEEREAKEQEGAALARLIISALIAVATGEVGMGFSFIPALSNHLVSFFPTHQTPPSTFTYTRTT
jgi:hypothetical protein